jgi:tetratricopeptide (TPR) repeat protein
MGESDTVTEVLRLLEGLTADAEFFQGLGKLLFKHRLVEGAKAAYDAALRLDPCDPFTHLYLGNWSYGQGDYAEAIERFEYAAELLPDQAVAYWCLGDVYERQGRLALADYYFHRAVRVAPRDRQARRRLREWLRRRPT